MFLLYKHISITLYASIYKKLVSLKQAQKHVKGINLNNLDAKIRKYNHFWN